MPQPSGIAHFILTSCDQRHWGIGGVPLNRRVDIVHAQCHMGPTRLRWMNIVCSFACHVFTLIQLSSHLGLMLLQSPDACPHQLQRLRDAARDLSDYPKGL